MRMLRLILARLRGLFRRDRLREESDEELRFHLEMEAEYHRGRGLSRADAHRAALLAFGGVQRFREETHDARVAVTLENIGKDFRLAVRRLRRTPGFTIAVTLTLAMAIGATASVFGVVDGVLLKTFPFRDADRVMYVVENNPVQRLTNFAISPLDYLDYRAQTRAFEALAAAEYGQGTVTGPQEPERIVTRAVTPNYFPVLGITPALGRTFAADSAGPAEVMIAYEYWQRRFGGATSVLGQKLVLDDQPYTIVGVLPFVGLDEAGLWTRLSLQPNKLVHRDWHYLGVTGRLRAGVTPEEAQRELQTIAARLAQTYPQTNENWSAEAVPLLDELVGPIRPALVTLLSAAGCVLLIGVANLANLFLVRCLGRERELAVRVALGATRGRLVRELLIEAATLGMTAGAIGVGMAILGVRVLRMLAPSTLPRLDQVHVDGRVVAFCALTSIATVIVLGMLPAWQATRGAPADTMKGAGRGTDSARHHRLQNAFVVLQVAVALVLLTGTGLMVESFEQFRRTDMGFRPGGVLTARLALSGERYATGAREAALGARVIEQLAAQPGIESVAAGSALPGSAETRFAVRVVGDVISDPTHAPTVRPVFVSPGYLHTMGITLRRGRGLLPADGRAAVKVAVIDERLIPKSFGDRNPIGERLAVLGFDMDTVEIVGIAAAVKQGGIVAEDVPWVYMSLDQARPSNGSLSVAIRASGKPEAQIMALKRALAGIDPTVPIFDVKSMDARVAQSVDLTRFSTFLASLFTALALTLGVVGIYSLLAYVVSQRRREIAIRLALGATSAHIMRDVVRSAFTLTCVGIALGSGASWWLTRSLSGLFEGVSPHDPRVFAGAAILFAVAALMAAPIPAFRATRVNPVTALTAS